MSFTWSLSCPVLSLSLDQFSVSRHFHQGKTKRKNQTHSSSFITCWQLEWNTLWVGVPVTFGSNVMFALSACVLCCDFPITSDIWLGHSVWLSSYEDRYMYLNMWCNFKFQKNSESPYFHQLLFFYVEVLFHLKSHMFQTLPLFFLNNPEKWMTLVLFYVI